MDFRLSNPVGSNGKIDSQRLSQTARISVAIGNRSGFCGSSMFLSTVTKTSKFAEFDSRKIIQQNLQAVTAFDIIEQVLHRHSGTTKNRRPRSSFQGNFHKFILIKIQTHSRLDYTIFAHLTTAAGGNK